MTELKPNLFAVVVDKEITNLEFNEREIIYNYYLGFFFCEAKIKLPKGKFQPIGFIENDWFDLEMCAIFELVPEDIYSLLQSKELSWVNPMPHPSDIDAIQKSHYDKLKTEWQSWESKLLKPNQKLIIIHKVN